MRRGPNGKNVAPARLFATIPLGLRKIASICVPIALGFVLGLGGVYVLEPRLPTSPTLRGLRVGGEELSLGNDPRAFLEQRAERFAAREISLLHGGKSFPATLGSVGVEVDVDATLARALEVGHSGSVVRRLRQTREARRGEVDVPLVYRFDAARARAYIRRFEDDLRRAPVDAELDLEGHQKVPDVPGAELDLAATVAAIEEGFSGGESLHLISREVQANVTLHDLDDIAVDKVLGAFETKYQTFKKGRSANVELAARKLNGFVIRPRQVVSFNDRVGPRTEERGFQQAPEIVGDELTVGIGGGTCQVSSTLHGAALYGGLKIVQRKSHTRPSSYTLLGLDATVAYPSVDLRLQNPYAFPIVVHSFVPEPGTLRVEILGGDEVESVKYKYGVARIEEYVRRITVKSWLTPGRSFRKQKGTRGMDVFSYVTIRYRDGRVEERQYYSGYRPTPEVFWVAPDYDEESLPPLPDHAKGVEGRLAEDGSDVYPSTG